MVAKTIATPIYLWIVQGNVQVKEMARASRAFCADLPDMSAEALEKLYTWGKTSCEKTHVSMDAHGKMILVALRKKQGTARDHQRNLRTLLQNWGVELPQRQPGWLRLIDESDLNLQHPCSPAEKESIPMSEEQELLPTYAPPSLTRPTMRLQMPKNLLRCAA